jgi:hypothetical protein
VKARRLVERRFDGQGSYALLVVVSSPTQSTASPAFRTTVGRVGHVLRRDPAVGAIRRLQATDSAAQGGHGAVMQAGAAAETAEMVRAASRLRGALQSAAAPGIAVSLTRLSGLVGGIQRPQRGGDDALRPAVLAADAGRARRRIRLARRGWDRSVAGDPGPRRHRRWALDRTAADPHHDLGDRTSP